MATETVNGTYAQTNGQSSDAAGANSAGANSNFDAYGANQAASATTEQGHASSADASSTAKADVPRDEIGWYFVEQYYTTLSKTPEKLFLFYNKQSQFVSGAEAEKVGVCVGQKTINERIKQLDFHDCKVRVTNVDSQGSRSSIVIQVIGEISNKAQPTRKFTQTFVLAEQTNGYFVLNDIFRYIIDDEEYEPGEGAAAAPRVDEAATGVQESAAAAAAAADEPEAKDASAAVVSKTPDPDVVARSLEAVKNEDGSAVPTVNGHPAPAADAPVADEEETSAPAAAADAAGEDSTPQPTAPVTEEAVDLSHEKPAAPEPTPAVLSPKPAAPVQAAAPAAPAKPSGPKSWATIAGGSQAARVTPAVPTVTAPGAAAAAAPAAAKAAPAAAPAASPTFPTSPAAFTAQATEPERAGTPNSGSGWQTAGHEHTRKQSRPQGIQQQQPSGENTRGYVKGVTENINEEALRLAIGVSAVPSFIDISRIKSCAFVDFANAADYRAAVAGNPYDVNGTSLYVEERKIRPQTGPNSYANRGRGRGGFIPGQAQGRGGMQRDGPPRGSFNGRGRGGFRGGRGGPIIQPTV